MSIDKSHSEIWAYNQATEIQIQKMFYILSFSPSGSLSEGRDKDLKPAPKSA